MKKRINLLVFSLVVPLLAGCSSGSPEEQKHKVTFHQDNAEDFVVEFDKNTKQSEVEIKEPQLVNKDGYTVAWEDYSIEGKTSSFTVNAIYTPVVYHVDFKAQGTLLDSVPFTIEDIHGEHSKLPAYKEPKIPANPWCTPYWEDYSLALSDLTVNAMYDHLKTYTVKFVAKGVQLGQTISYTKNDIDAEGKIRQDLIPQSVLDYKVEHYDVIWNFQITEPKDLIIQPQINIHNYYLSFLDFEGNQIGENVAYNHTSTWESINKPTVPSKTGYDTFWPKTFDLSFEDTIQEVNPLKKGKIYTISYTDKGDSQDVTFGEKYTLKYPSTLTTSWKNGEVQIPDQGIWSIPNNVDVTCGKTSRKYFGEVPSCMKLESCQNISALEMERNGGINGNDAIKITVSKGDYGVYFDKSALDEIFADSSVNVLNIVAKSNIQNSNFRHRTAGTNVCYELNSSTFGINLEYKSFSFTREMYNAHTNGDFIIYGGNGSTTCAGQIIYIDSLIYGNVNSIGADISFEDGYVIDSSEGQWLQKRFYHTNNVAGNAKSFIMVQGEAEKIEIYDTTYSYEHVTNGIRSMAFNKSEGYIALYIKETFFNDLKQSASKSFSFDLYTEMEIPTNNIMDGMNNAFSEPHPAQQFKTYTLTCDYDSSGKATASSQLTNDGRFLIIQGNTSGWICLDNLRITK